LSFENIHNKNRAIGCRGDVWEDVFTIIVDERGERQRGESSVKREESKRESTADVFEFKGPRR
jgi:hypothetical protein